MTRIEHDLYQRKIAQAIAPIWVRREVLALCPLATSGSKIRRPESSNLSNSTDRLADRPAAPGLLRSAPKCHCSIAVPMLQTSAEKRSLAALNHSEPQSSRSQRAIGEALWLKCTSGPVAGLTRLRRSLGPRCAIFRNIASGAARD